jgi:hypothetical protein
MLKEQNNFERYLNVRAAFAPSFSYDGAGSSARFLDTYMEQE